MKQRMGLVLLLVAMLALLAGCKSTPLALVDDTWGFEHVTQDHAVHLASPRMVLAPRAGAATDANRQHDFKLSLRFVNKGSTPWSVASRGFALEVNACDGEQCSDISVVVAQLPDPIAVVPPGEEVAYELPLTTTTGPGERRLEKFTLDLAYTEGDQQLMSRRLLFGEFNQGWQIVRLLGTITSGVLAAFLL